MKILSIDSSGMVASVAVTEDDTLLAEYTVNNKLTHSQTLLPMLDEIVRMLGMELSSIDAIAVAGGPGSFTGLRIGSATAKGLGLALQKPIVSVPTVEGLAYNLYGCKALVCPLMDARRNQVYTGLYRFGEDGMETLMEQTPLGVDALVQRINEQKIALQSGVMFLGDGVPVYRAQLDELLTVKHEYAPSHLNRQRAGAIGALACRYLAAGETQTAAEHAPVYLRLSQAERERREKEAAERGNKTHH